MFGLERGKGGNLVTWLILGILALAFGFTFGLPSDQLSFGESGLIKVHGTNVAQDDFVYQRQVMSQVMRLPEGEDAQVIGVREEVLEAVVERLLLAHIGERLGLMTEIHDAEVMTKDGLGIVLGQDMPYRWAGTDDFSYQEFKQILGAFGVSETRYLEIQRQELLARQVRDLLESSITIPEPEVWAEYERQRNKLSLSYVRFPSSEYADLVDPSEADIDAWMADHQAELEESWEINQPRFRKLPPQVDLRLIQITKPVALPANLADDEELVAEQQERLAAARATAEAARARVVEAGESFAAVAREVSRHADTARAGGRFGWTIVTDPGSGLDPLIDATAATLEAGAISEVVEGDDAFYIVMVAGHRVGDTPEELAKRELAAEAFRLARGKELAKRAADEALLAVQSGTALDELFAGKPAMGAGTKNIEDYGLEGETDTLARSLEETGLFGYGEAIPGIGAHPGLTNAAWKAGPEAPILGEVFVVPGGWLIAAVDERMTVDEAGYADARPEIYARLAQMRAHTVLATFTKHECYLGKARVDIRVNHPVVNRLMSYDGKIQTDDEGVRLTPPYRTCARVGEGGGMLRLQQILRGSGL
jgi:peptidyl-prolyl cis-trans isomerase D